MEDEEMEFLNGICKKEVTEWDELTGTSLLNQEVVLEGAVHSIRNMGDVAFVILRRREGLFQTVVENEKANLSIHDLKEGMTVRVKGVVNKEVLHADAQIAYAPCAAEICSFPKTIHHALFIRCLCIPKGVA